MIIDISGAVVFITEMKPLDQNANSTHIMTQNIINGIKKNKRKLILFIIDQHRNKQTLEQYFSDKVDGVCVLPSRFGNGLNKYQLLFRILKEACCMGYYYHRIDELAIIGIPQIIISNNPTYETALWGIALKKRFKESPFYQYWSDPITLSGITQEHYSLKRLPFRMAEHYAIKRADRVIYGTRTLMDFQCQLFPDLAHKITYIDIAYQETKYSNSIPDYRRRIIYAGNYDPTIRNIGPLVKAVEKMKDIDLDIYGTGKCVISNPKKIHEHGRTTPERITEIESHYPISVCILNSGCIQIPGKIFYSMNRKSEILVISDGPYSEKITAYLETYHRFWICHNTPESIHNTLNKILSNSCDREYDVDSFSPQRIAANLISGGLFLSE